VLAATPPDEPETAGAGGEAAQLSNSDFTWSTPEWKQGGWYARGAVRPGSPTYRIYLHYRDQMDPYPFHKVSWPFRVWLSALEDPNKRAPAMLLLSIVPRYEWLIAWDQQEELAGFYFPADTSTGKPELSRWKEFRDQWHDAMDEPCGVLFAGWPAALMLVLPLVWLSKPRLVEASFGRWLFNVLMSISLLILIAAITFLVRSYPGESWAIGPRPRPLPLQERDWPVNRPYVNWWIGVSRGRFQVLRKWHAQYWDYYVWPWSGHRRDWTLEHHTVRSRPQDRGGTCPGIELYYSPPTPVQVPDYADLLLVPYDPTKAVRDRIVTSLPTVYHTIRPEPTYGYVGGETRSISGMPYCIESVQSIIVNLHVMILGAAILPAISLRRTWRRYHSRLSNHCRRCSYDLTGNTSGICPECGASIAFESHAAIASPTGTLR
jgi:hypothetical protein